jgi:uncharacterized protein YggE
LSQAELYAKAAGTKVRRVLLIEEATPRLPGPVGFGMMTAERAVPVAPGEQQFLISINTNVRALE